MIQGIRGDLIIEGSGDLKLLLKGRSFGLSFA
jgi:hypothetical protein